MKELHDRPRFRAHRTGGADRRLAALGGRRSVARPLPGAEDRQAERPRRRRRGRPGQAAARGRWSFRIAEVDRSKKRFAIERKLLFTTLRFSFALDRPEEIEDGDTLEPQLPSDPDTWTATYTVTLKGTLAAIYDRTAARPIARQLERLAASVAESSPPQD
ncbi:hypothetical protein G7070_09490 [Propioniciclava coleopterorum]|uniref:Uncharacterized protein n=1 Tax=Propioniciclava coleopterorum TaxID=2714937 RepID=A0A6G7Y763_9ACTN|nr:hypothetical protein [Propioniciclava coleopterorum]QIK72457.1 hypothetical protein G7070_09490 [Propioniciclava coleopterorum]